MGCTEKAEYVTKAFESLSLPPVNENAPKSGSSSEDITGEANKPEEKGKVDKIKKEELDDVSLSLSLPLINAVNISRILINTCLKLFNTVAHITYSCRRVLDLLVMKFTHRYHTYIFMHTYM